jgi:hypothetical protein
VYASSRSRLENGVPLVGSVRRFVQAAKLDRIDLECTRELVERRLQRERPDRFTRRAHPGIGDGVEVDHLLADEEVVCLIEMTRRKRCTARHNVHAPASR